MSVPEQRTLTGPRWSLACRTGCTRATLYGFQGAPQEPVTPELQERFDLGNDLCDRQRDREIAGLTAEGWTCIPEAEVSWPADAPIGTGHADVFCIRAVDGQIEESAVLELTIEEEIGHKCLQAAGYAINAGATAATVVQIDRRTGRKHYTPIDVEGKRAEVEALQAAVVEAIAKGEADRVCSFPGEAKKRGCPFASHCFRDWTPPETDHLMPVLDEKLLSLAEAEDAYAEAKAVYDDAEKARKALREELRPYLPTGQDVVGAVGADASAVKVKVSVSYRTTFSLSDATKAGHEIPERLQAFVKTSAPIEKWTIRRIPGASR